MSDEKKEAISKEEQAELNEQKRKEYLRSLLANDGGKPSQEQIDGWKAQHGEVFMSALQDEELFVFRPVSRGEFRRCQESAVDEQSFEAAVVESSLLWTNVSNLESKAGTIPSLLEQIMQNSNFIPPAVAGQLVLKL